MPSKRIASLSAPSVVAASSSRQPWATASLAEAADTSPMELSALGAHVDHCNGSRSRWFSVQCAADTLLGFMAPRFVTTVVLVAIVFGVFSVVA